MRVQVGDQAPDFELPSSSGELFRLSSVLGHQAVVLYFYWKNGTPLCQRQACQFRDYRERFREAGAIVVGISSDSVESHQQVVSRLDLRFPLLSDESGTVRALYDVPKTWGLLPGRVTYVIDRDGIVRHIFSSWFEADPHVAAALETLNEGRPSLETSAGR